MTASYILTRLRVKKSELSSIFQGVQIMQEEYTAYDEILDEGRIDGISSLLLRQDRKRFGPPDAHAEAELAGIKDLDRLERFADAILTAKSWDELLATP